MGRSRLTGRPARRPGALRAALAALVALAVLGTAVVVQAQPQLLAGDPLAQQVTSRFAPKPDPPKGSDLPVARAAATDKPPAVDLVPEGAQPAPVSVPPPDDPLVASLAPRLQEAVLEAGPAGTSAVHVLDAQGRVVFDMGGTTPLIPASTAKLVTAAAALTAFGPDHTFTTRLAATAAPDAAGRIAGDLVLVGGGDPTLVSAEFVERGIAPERPSTRIAALADQLVFAGVTAVDGAVIGDPGFLQGDPLAEGWPPRYLDELDASRITGLTIDRGLTLQLPDGTEVVRAAEDPAAEAAAALSAALAERGIAVGGAPAAVPGAAATAVTELASTDSPPLMALLRSVVQDSDNHMADTLFRAVGRRVEGAGSFADGSLLTERVLADLQLDWSTTTLMDGSGLSRSTAIPPALLTTLNYRMTSSAVGAEWQELMAVSGTSGTLRSRLTDTIAELRLRGKTGSLQDVRALSGAVVGPDGRPLYVTVTSNAVDGPELANARRLQDLVVLALAAELYGCTELPPPTPDPAAPPPEPGELPPLPTHTCVR